MKAKTKKAIVDIMNADAKDGLYAREYNSPLVQQLIDETYPEEMNKLDKEMSQTALEFYAEKDNLLMIDFLEGRITAVELGIRKTALFYQSKEKEREQMLEFWEGGINCTEEGGKSFDQFVKENYGGAE